MDRLAIAVVFCIVAVYSVSNVDAQSTGSLMCYNCTYVTIAGFSAGDAGCQDPFSASGISQISCDGSCTKRKLEGDIPTVMRTCFTALEGDCIELDRFEISPGNHVTQKCCTGNLCNGAGAVTFSLLVAVATVCGALAVKY